MFQQYVHHYTIGWDAEGNPCPVPIHCTLRDIDTHQVWKVDTPVQTAQRGYVIALLDQDQFHLNQVGNGYIGSRTNVSNFMVDASEEEDAGFALTIFLEKTALQKL